MLYGVKMDLTSFDFFGLSAGRLIVSFAILLIAFIARKIFDRFLNRVVKGWVGKTDSKLDDIFLESIQPPLMAAVIMVGIYLALVVLDLPMEPYDFPQMISEGWSVSVLLLIIWASYRFCIPLTVLLEGLLCRTDETLAKQFSPIIRKSLRGGLLAIATILIIQNMGYKVTSLITGLGIGGLAVALAAQDAIANIFGTIVMLTDKPFRIGDWVYFDGMEGTVEEIGFRSTKIRTWAKSLVIIPNKLLTEKRIENWSAMPKRRVKMTIGLTYGTSRSNMEDFIVRVRDLLANDQAVDQEFSMVNFTGFGESSLDVLLYYFTRTTVWQEFMDERQRLNLELMRIAEEVGVSFAFPSKTHYFGESLKIQREDLTASS
jgi:MscS family membrane protein